MRKKVLATSIAFLLTILSVNSDVAAFDGPPSGGPSSSASVSWSGANTITAAASVSGQTYSSTTADQNALLINTSSNVTITNPTVTKSGGTSASDNYSFYGINSGVMCKGGGTTKITGGTVTTNAEGANGIFSYGANSGQTNATGDGTTVYVKDTNIKTTGAGSGGIMTTYGGKTIATNLTIETSGGSSAPIRTDRGGGYVSVTGGTYKSNGQGSPAIYSTADVRVSGATLTSTKSEGVCIEGTGSIALTNCNLTASNTTLNGNATFYDTIMIYQSMSGDASNGTSSFTMTGGSLNSQKGHTFHVTNTTATIALSGVNISNSSDAVLLSVCDDGWSGGTNNATFNASSQALDGDVLVGNGSYLTMNLSDSSTFNGRVHGTITNGKGSSVSSTTGTVNMTIGAGCTWTLTGDSYVTSLSNNGTINTNGYSLYVNGSDYETGAAAQESTSDATADNSGTSVGKILSTSSGQSYQVNTDGESVTLKKTQNKKSVKIGSTITDDGKEYKVTELAKKSITGKKVKKVTINAANLTTVDSNAFKGAKNLEKVTIKGVKKKSKIAKKIVKAAQKVNKNVKVVYS